MATTLNFCKTDGATLTYAPTYLVHDGALVINPGADVYAAHGWLQNAVQPPSPPAGQMVASTRYEVVDGRISAIYEYADAPRTPRVFSKLYLILALKRRGLYEAFKAMLQSADLVDEWTAANELNEAYEGFSDYLAQAQAALGLTDAEAEAVLAEAVAR